jgi:3-carboxy-cis,cis-muconate cycloisomerase
MTYSLFDHPHFQGLLQDEAIALLFEVEAEIEAMLRFEGALAEAEAALGVVPEAAKDAVLMATAGFRPDPEILQAGVARDGLAVPALIKALRETIEEPHRAHLHFGATSQDVVDTGLILRLKDAFSTFEQRLDRVIGALDDLSAKAGDAPIVGRTRMQRALPITLADRVATWRAPLLRQREALAALADRVLVVQFGGAVGTLDKLGDRGPAVRAALAERLGLKDPGRAWHAERDRIADLAGWLATVSGCLGKIGQDIALMAQNEVGEAVVAGGGRSSAMPHKRNPILAEILVTLARYNAGQLGALHQALVHEGERSGSAWTLEWFVLPSMLGTAAASLRVAERLLDGLTCRASTSVA